MGAGIGGQNPVNLDKQRVDFAKPPMAMSENEVYRTLNFVHFALLQIPLHLGQLAFVEKSAWQGIRL